MQSALWQTWPVKKDSMNKEVPFLLKKTFLEPLFEYLLSAYLVLRIVAPKYVYIRELSSREDTLFAVLMLVIFAALMNHRSSENFKFKGVSSPPPRSNNHNNNKKQ